MSNSPELEEIANQVKEIVDNLKQASDDFELAVGQTWTDLVRVGTEAFIQALTSGQGAANQFSELMTHPIIMAFLVGVSLGGMLVKFCMWQKRQWSRASENQ